MWPPKALRKAMRKDKAKEQETFQGRRISETRWLSTSYPPDLLSFGAYISSQPFIKQIKG